jgi:hypothetical protein
MPDTLSREQQTLAQQYQEHVDRVWNQLIPACAVRAVIEPWGVRYLHPTKGYKTVGKRHFAIRGVA